ncbi:hypothetical protein BFP97_04820 [Roseivirga sp. 4D4]|uniref:CIA30 family protein n=1 Tax=Roseivirga sp. 4D4 TaxID=1889784 RepID=UPI000852D9D1|nr:CIA30 family protein [Roseivirga sp. 4D4]OEK00872.1 hypothetical protein BFP97_04820 [Roseivirga sp. 4D4]
MIYCLILFTNLFFNTNSWVFDFGEGKTGEEWMIVNDGVMGGLSRGKVEFNETTITFSGDVSLENNGGFTSFRSPYGLYDLSEYDKVEIKYRLDGLNCALSFDQNRRFWRPNHKMPLPSTDNIWMTLEANLYELSQYQMGRETGRRMSPYNAKNTIRLGIITDSKEAGSFKLEIDYIKFFKAEN